MSVLQCACGHFSIPLRIAERYGMLKSSDDSCYENLPTVTLPSCQPSAKTIEPKLQQPQSQQAQCRLCKAEGRPFVGHTLPQCSSLTKQELQDLLGYDSEEYYSEVEFVHNHRPNSDTDYYESEDDYEDHITSRHRAHAGDNDSCEKELYYQYDSYDYHDNGGHDSETSESQDDDIQSFPLISVNRVSVDMNVYSQEDTFEHCSAQDCKVEIDFCMLCQQSFYTSSPVDIMDPEKCYCGNPDIEPQHQHKQEDDIDEVTIEDCHDHEDIENREDVFDNTYDHVSDLFTQENDLLCSKRSAKEGDQDARDHKTIGKNKTCVVVMQCENANDSGCHQEGYTCIHVDDSDGYDHKEVNVSEHKVMSKCESKDDGYCENIARCEDDLTYQNECVNVNCDLLQHTKYDFRNHNHVCADEFDQEGAAGNALRFTKERQEDHQKCLDVSENEFNRETHGEHHSHVEVQCVNDYNRGDANGGKDNGFPRDIVGMCDGNTSNTGHDRLKDKCEDNKKFVFITDNGYDEWMNDRTNMVRHKKDDGEYVERGKDCNGATAQHVDSLLQADHSVALSKSPTHLPPGISTCATEQADNIIFSLQLLVQLTNQALSTVDPLRFLGDNMYNMMPLSIRPVDISQQIQMMKCDYEKYTSLMPSHDNNPLHCNSPMERMVQYSLHLPFIGADTKNGNCIPFMLPGTSVSDTSCMQESKDECSATLLDGAKENVMTFSSDYPIVNHYHPQMEPQMFIDTSDEVSDCAMHVMTKIRDIYVYSGDCKSHMYFNPMLFGTCKPGIKYTSAEVKIAFFSQIRPPHKQDDLLFNHSTRPPEYSMAPQPAKA